MRLFSWRVVRIMAIAWAGGIAEGARRLYRFHRPRWRLRTLMIAVAVVGVGLGSILAIERRRAEFRRRWDFYFGQKLKFPYPWPKNPTIRCANATCPSYQAEGYPPTADGFHQHPVLGLLKRSERDWLAYSDQMAEKYFRAGWFPWLPIAPDPPAPPEPPAHDWGTLTPPASAWDALIQQAPPVLGPVQAR